MGASATKPPQYQADMATSMVLAQSGTISISKRIAPDSIAGRGANAVVARANNIVGTPAVGQPPAAEILKSHHLNEQFNFLYVDGHVELRSRAASPGSTSAPVFNATTFQSGSWSVHPRD